MLERMYFLDALQEDLNRYIMTLIEKDVDMIWDGEARERFLLAAHCHICKEELNRMVEPVVRDHCHFTGRFRHQHCSLNYKIDINYQLYFVIFVDTMPT